MASSSPSEARELELVGKVEMRIALSNDEKLESVLKVYLPPLLLKLASDHVAVRNKVCPSPSFLPSRTPLFRLPSIRWTISAELYAGDLDLSTYQN